MELPQNITDKIDTTDTEVSIKRRDSVNVFRIANANAMAPTEKAK